MLLLIIIMLAIGDIADVRLGYWLIFYPVLAWNVNSLQNNKYMIQKK